ncbi:MAG TPA: mercuric transport protein MerTP [Sphingobacteriaceae bacterium]|nr:mercuric transport protein MerTP [Sphingobacteriaceae bacterium]
MKTVNKTGLAGAGVFSAIAASLCCITPVLALISGASGMASAFSWMEAWRPYLIAVTVAVLVFAWYQKLRPIPDSSADCACETDEKPSFLNTKAFLGLVTILAFLMLTFPYYGQFFYPKTESQSTTIVPPRNVEQIQFKVEGMTCESCQAHIEHSVKKLPGIVRVEANYTDGTATVQYDPSKSNKGQLVSAINETGYKVQTELSNK